jgi:hypothetical protein
VLARATRLGGLHLEALDVALLLEDPRDVLAQPEEGASMASFWRARPLRIASGSRLSGRS